MKNIIKIYIICVKTSLSRITAYRVNFILGVFITLFGNLAFPLVTVLIYNAGASFPGWGFHEVLLMQSIFTVSGGISGMLLDGVLWETMGHIREGTFEVVLLKPVSPLFYLISSNFEPESIGVILGGIAIFIYAVSVTGIASLFSVLAFIVFFIAGLAVMAGFSLFMAAASFKWVANSRLPEIFDSLKSFGKYPINIFPTALRSVITYIIPVGMIGFFPAEALLGEPEPAAFVMVLPCVVFMFIGVFVYRYMIKLYSGVGG